MKDTKISNDVRNKAVGYILAAFGLVAGLAWNEAIKDSISLLYEADENSIIAKFIYAIVMTVVVVAVSTLLLKGEEDTKTKKKK